ncbi:uncharacterized protein LOC122378145 [Amphibalanus amphitrite]|uniref:uncharacterized protein LOC122378145 n=1 Tax=Amphibalanus amphitrite TaxID=1232801 RepID=UPI001C9099A8|nr:uncharacterized protein LOC122378145 [Amphibalanus amphitrite]
MLERACRAVYALAELLCVIGLLVLCVLKVQHFLSHPVSTTVSYQPSRPPAITVCHQLVDEQAVGELENQFWIEYSDTLDLCLEISKLLQQTKLAVEDFQTRPDVSNETDVSAMERESYDLIFIITSVLRQSVNETKELLMRQLEYNYNYAYSTMNISHNQLEGILRETLEVMQEVLHFVSLYDSKAVNDTTQGIDGLLNVTQEIQLNLANMFELSKPSPVRLLAEASRSVDQFVISCKRGHSSCMPGEGGQWQLRHVLETEERCYTLMALEEEISAEDATVVLELRGNRWKPNTVEKDDDVTTESSEAWSTLYEDQGLNTTNTTLDEGTTETTEDPRTEQEPTDSPETTTEADFISTTEADIDIVQETTFYPIENYNDTYTLLQSFNLTPVKVAIERVALMVPTFPEIHRIQAPPIYVRSFQNLQSSPDAIQYVVYKVMLHAAPVPLLDAPSGLRERSFEIFNNQDWVEVDVRMEELRSLNRKSRPCEEDPAYSRGRCLSECQAAAHAREAGCQLEAVWPATAQGLPQCETATQLERLRAELAAPPSCACPRPCRQGRVSAVVQASSRTASDHEVTVTVRVDGDMQVIEESAAYTAGSLLTDFGGNMGLTMGFSLLTIVELLKKITFGCLDGRI